MIGPDALELRGGAGVACAICDNREEFGWEVQPTVQLFTDLLVRMSTIETVTGVVALVTGVVSVLQRRDPTLPNVPEWDEPDRLARSLRALWERAEAARPSVVPASF